MSARSEKWTPGPWKKNRFGELSGPNGEHVNVWDAGIGYASRSAETEANGILIAAAPDLFEALAKYVEHVGDPLRVANAALAKARGEV